LLLRFLGGNENNNRGDHHGDYASRCCIIHGALSLFFRPIWHNKLCWIGHDVRFDHLSFLMKSANDASLLVFYVLLELFIFRRSEVNPKVL